MRNFTAFLTLLALTWSITGCTAPKYDAANRRPAQIAGTTGEITDPDYIPPLARDLPLTPGSKSLTVISWNVKHLGRKDCSTDPNKRGCSLELAAKDFARDRAPSVLADADVITFQEVNTSGSGLDALNAIARTLSEKTGEKICKGLSARPSDGLELYGFLWKDSRVAYIKTNGEPIETCPSTAITIRLVNRNADQITREPAVATFYFRPEAKPFVLASIHLRPSGKKPQDEVVPLFSAMENVQWPVIVAGDYNLDARHPIFAQARDLKFEPALVGVKTSLQMKRRGMSKAYDNFWTRGLTLQHQCVVPVHDKFPDLSPQDIYNGVSDHAPIVAQFSFSGATPLADTEIAKICK